MLKIGTKVEIKDHETKEWIPVEVTDMEYMSEIELTASNGYTYTVDLGDFNDRDYLRVIEEIS